MNLKTAVLLIVFIGILNGCSTPERKPATEKEKEEETLSTKSIKPFGPKGGAHSDR